MRIGIERVTNALLKELKPLMEMHEEEVRQAGIDVPMNVNKDLYLKGCSGGFVKTFVAREGGEAVGYCTYFISPATVYKNVMTASQDALFLHPNYRGKMLGVKLLRTTEKELKKLGVGWISQHTTLKVDVGKLFERLGYVEAEKIYLKEI